MTRTEKYKDVAEMARREDWWFKEYDKYYENLEEENERLGKEVETLLEDVKRLEEDLKIANIRAKMWEDAFDGIKERKVSL